MKQAGSRLAGCPGAEERLRWLLLAAVGAPLAGCAGRTTEEPAERATARLSAQVQASLEACETAEDLGGGFLRCENGLIHRPVSGECPVRPNDASPTMGPEIGGACRVDADCDESAHGSCQLGQGGYYCHYGCVVDADCGSGQVCFCGAEGYPAGRCVDAGCTTDADCDGLLCADYVPNPYCGYKAFACQTPRDVCSVDADCPEGTSGCTICEADSFGCDDSSKRSCSQSHCVIGRPFLVGGAQRVAPLASDAAWLSTRGAPRAEPVTSPTLAEALAEAWALAGRMEHASVAAFARFSLQLASLGAPPQLLAATARAMQDEIEHAQGCFALASRHAGRPLGPGPLDVSGSLGDADLETILTTAIAEGCVGETVAALEAAEAHAGCRDPEARELLGRIAEEEGRHAELAWRFVRWALSSFPDAEAPVRAAFERACALDANGDALGSSCDETLSETLSEGLLAHGVLDPATKSAVRRRALSGVVMPAARALFENLAPASRVAALDARESCPSPAV